MSVRKLVFPYRVVGDFLPLPCRIVLDGLLFHCIFVYFADVVEQSTDSSHLLCFGVKLSKPAFKLTVVQQFLPEHVVHVERVLTQTAFMRTVILCRCRCCKKVGSLQPFEQLLCAASFDFVVENFNEFFFVAHGILLYFQFFIIFRSSQGLPRAALW